MQAMMIFYTLLQLKRERPPQVPVVLVEELSIGGHFAFSHGSKGIAADLSSGGPLGLGGGQQGLHQGTALHLSLRLQRE